MATGTESESTELGGACGAGLGSEEVVMKQEKGGSKGAKWRAMSEPPIVPASAM